MISLFFILLFLIFYSYIGYGLILWLINNLKRSSDLLTIDFEECPFVTLVIPAYNEMYIIDKKMQNSYQLVYPKEKLNIAWITDGSDDGSNIYLSKNYPDVQVWHQSERLGKAAAINRAIELSQTEIIIFCDANTMLNKDALVNIVKWFKNEKVGVVAGEKRVFKNNELAGSGESLYWKYESWLKKQNAQFYSSVGAVGELFAIKKSLVKPLPLDTIVDDFVLSMEIAHNGYIIAYAPDAYAEEEPSANEKEELKRKIRIAAGAFQALFRYLHWLNFLKHFRLSFQYLSHKVIRWLLVPILLPMIFILNIYLVTKQDIQNIFIILLILQVFFYLIVVLNLLIKNLPKLLYIPYYIVLMNYAQYAGLVKYISKSQPAAWEKVKRKVNI